MQSRPFDLNTVQPEIDKARFAFADYLSSVPRKKESKHGLMGPVGKILSEAKTGRRDPASLKGYALSVHESAVAQARGAAGRSLISAAAMADLDRGISTLVGFLANIPVTFQDRALDRLDYGLYWELRKRDADTRQAWIKFMKDRYPDEASLEAAWGKKGITFDKIYLPGKTERAGSPALEKAFADFWESQQTVLLLDEEEE